VAWIGACYKARSGIGITVAGTSIQSGFVIVEWYQGVFELIDMRSFSNLWFWIALAVVWSSTSHWVLGVPFDMVVRARRKGGQAEEDLETIVRVNVNRMLMIARVSGLWIMGLGLDWVLFVARTVAQWEGAVRHVLSPNAMVLPLIAGGASVIVLWHGRGRWAGLLPIAVASMMWMTATRPDILIAEKGALVGVLTAQGRAMSRDKGSGFGARVWLENDGHGLTQPSAAALWPAQGQPLGATLVRHVHGKRAAARFTGCDAGEIVIASASLPDPAGPVACQMIGPEVLKGQGSLALSQQPDGTFRIQSAKQSPGARLWNDRQARRR